MIKKLFFLLVVMLTIYAPCELTRVILTANLIIGKVDILRLLVREQIVEVAFIWVGYVAAMMLVWRLVWKRKT